MYLSPQLDFSSVSMYTWTRSRMLMYTHFVTIMYIVKAQFTANENKSKPMHSWNTQRVLSSPYFRYVPRKHGRYEPGQQAYQGSPGLRADVSGLQWLADGVVSFEANRQNG